MTDFLFLFKNYFKILQKLKKNTFHNDLWAEMQVTTYVSIDIIHYIFLGKFLFPMIHFPILKVTRGPRECKFYFLYINW